MLLGRFAGSLQWDRRCASDADKAMSDWAMCFLVPLRLGRARAGHASDTACSPPASRRPAIEANDGRKTYDGAHWRLQMQENVSANGNGGGEWEMGNGRRGGIFNQKADPRAVTGP